MEALEVRMIIEMMGRPPEHLMATLKTLLEKLSQEKGVAIKNSRIRDPIKVEGSESIFSTFAEVEVVFDSVPVFLGITFAYMPSNVEVISPSNFKLSNEEITSIGNNIVVRLHQYDAVAKKLIADREILINRVKELMGQKEDKKSKNKPHKTKISKVEKKIKKKSKG